MTTQQTKWGKSCRRGTVERENAIAAYLPRVNPVSAPHGAYSGRALAEAEK